MSAPTGGPWTKVAKELRRAPFARDRVARELYRLLVDLTAYQTAHCFVSWTAIAHELAWLNGQTHKLETYSERVLKRAMALLVDCGWVVLPTKAQRISGARLGRSTFRVELPMQAMTIVRKGPRTGSEASDVQVGRGGSVQVEKPAKPHTAGTGDSSGDGLGTGSAGGLGTGSGGISVQVAEGSVQVGGGGSVQVRKSSKALDPGLGGVESDGLRTGSEGGASSVSLDVDSEESSSSSLSSHRGNGTADEKPTITTGACAAKMQEATGPTAATHTFTKAVTEIVSATGFGLPEIYRLLEELAEGGALRGKKPYTVKKQIVAVWEARQSTPAAATHAASRAPSCAECLRSGPPDNAREAMVGPGTAEQCDAVSEPLCREHAAPVLAPSRAAAFAAAEFFVAGHASQAVVADELPQPSAVNKRKPRRAAERRQA